jgi:hypothetical protein
MEYTCSMKEMALKRNRKVEQLLEYLEDEIDLVLGENEQE